MRDYVFFIRRCHVLTGTVVIKLSIFLLIHQREYFHGSCYFISYQN